LRRSACVNCTKHIFGRASRDSRDRRKRAVSEIETRSFRSLSSFQLSRATTTEINEKLNEPARETLAESKTRTGRANIAPLSFSFHPLDRIDRVSSVYNTHERSIYGEPRIHVSITRRDQRASMQSRASIREAQGSYPLPLRPPLYKRETPIVRID